MENHCSILVLEIPPSFQKKYDSTWRQLSRRTFTAKGSEHLSCCIETHVYITVAPRQDLLWGNTKTWLSLYPCDPVFSQCLAYTMPVFFFSALTYDQNAFGVIKAQISRPPCRRLESEFRDRIVQPGSAWRRDEKQRLGNLRSEFSRISVPRLHSPHYLFFAPHLIEI